MPLVLTRSLPIAGNYVLEHEHWSIYFKDYKHKSLAGEFLV